jgi:hypothetical protein
MSEENKMPPIDIGLPARLIEQPVIYFAETGSLCVALDIALVNSPVPWRGKHTIVMVKSDGTGMEGNLNTLRKCFDCNLNNPYALIYENPDEPDDSKLVVRDLTTFDLEVVGKKKNLPEKRDPETGEVTYPARDVFDIKWLNPAGGGSRMPDAADRRMVLAKYGAKFRAMSGPPKAAPVTKPSTPAPKPVEEQPEQAPEDTKATAKSPGRPAVNGPVARKPTAKVARTSTLDETFKLLCDKLGVTESEEDREKADQASRIFWVMADKFGATESITIQQWGQIADEVDVATADDLWAVSK